METVGSVPSSSSDDSSEDERSKPSDVTIFFLGVDLRDFCRFGGLFVGTGEVTFSPKVFTSESRSFGPTSAGAESGRNEANVDVDTESLMHLLFLTTGADAVDAADPSIDENDGGIGAVVDDEDVRAVMVDGVVDDDVVDEVAAGKTTTGRVSSGCFDMSPSFETPVSSSGDGATSWNVSQLSTFVLATFLTSTTTATVGMETRD